MPEEAQPESQRSYTLEEALDYALEVKKSSIRSTSYASYKSTVKLFKHWALESRLSGSDVGYFDRL